MINVFQGNKHIASTDNFQDLIGNTAESLFQAHFDKTPIRLHRRGLISDMNEKLPKCSVFAIDGDFVGSNVTINEYEIVRVNLNNKSKILEIYVK